MLPRPGPARQRPRSRTAVRASPAPPGPAASGAADAERDRRANRPADGTAPLDLETVRKIWPEVLAKLPATSVWRLSQVEPIAVGRTGYPGHRRRSRDTMRMEADPGITEILENLGHKFKRLVHRPVTVRYERPVAPRTEGCRLAAGRVPADRFLDGRSSDPEGRRAVRGTLRATGLRRAGPDFHNLIRPIGVRPSLRSSFRTFDDG